MGRVESAVWVAWVVWAAQAGPVALEEQEASAEPEVLVVSVDPGVSEASVVAPALRNCLRAAVAGNTIPNIVVERRMVIAQQRTVLAALLAETR